MQLLSLTLTKILIIRITKTNKNFQSYLIISYQSYLSAKSFDNDSLTHWFLMPSFSTPGFPTFSEDRERVHWEEMG